MGARSTHGAGSDAEWFTEFCANPARQLLAGDGAAPASAGAGCADAPPLRAPAFAGAGDAAAAGAAAIGAACAAAALASPLAGEVAAAGEAGAMPIEPIALFTAFCPAC